MEIYGPGQKIEELLRNQDTRTDSAKNIDNWLKLALIAGTILVIGQSCIDRIAPEFYQKFIAKDNYTQTIQKY